MLTSEGIEVIVHATHEAAYKIGGIGAVLDGLLSATPYLKNVGRSVLVGPFDSRDAVGIERLHAPSNGLSLHYSSADGVSPGDALSQRLRAIEAEYGVRILYGTRRFGQAQHEVILVDPNQAGTERVNNLKYGLWQRYGLQSDRYESNWEYDYYIRAAEPQYLALEAVLGPDLQRQRLVMMSHEFMGVPLCLVAEMRRPGAFCRVYYAHETPPVRPIVESHPGHDTMFYNAMRLAQRDGLSLGRVFGDQSGFFKAALLDLAADFQAVFAVGDLVVEELRFLGPRFANKAVDLVYNGIPAPARSFDEKLRSRRRMQTYARNLLGWTPDYIFTHVARLVTSKGLWRDLRLLEHLDDQLARRGATGVLFVLASALGSGRRAEDIARMETEYGWPLEHREGPPDLVGQEVPFYEAVTAFNKQAKAIRIVFVNQFGWSRQACGQRMPEDMTFADIRVGSDLEFGQSIYEPFGIAQFEPLPYGALCVVSSACGCVGFAQRSGADASSGVIVADYISLPPNLKVQTWSEAVQIGQDTRDLVERFRAREAAEAVISHLPADDAERGQQMRRGYELARRMTWDVVVSDYMLPALARALHAGS